MEKPLVVVLAAGIGKRFTPLTIDKTLLPLLGKPFLEHVFELIQSAGLKDVFVVTNNSNNQWVKSYQSQLTIKTKLFDKPTGMGAALLHIKQDLADKPVLVMNAVDMVDKKLLLAVLDKAKNAYAVIPGIEMSSYFPGGYLELKNDKVVSIIEKPDPDKIPSNLVDLVVHYFSKPQEFLSILASTPPSISDQHEKALATLMKQKPVDFVRYNGYWAALKYQYQVLDMTEVFLKHKLISHQNKTATISSQAVIEGDVLIEQGARIDAGAVIVGPSYIGRNVRIGSHTLIRQSTIEEGAVIGFGSEVARSYVGPKCMLHHNFIGDSILESSVNPSFGTVTANLRFDEKPIAVKLVGGERIQTNRTKLGAILAKGVYSGVNCSYMPGITVGANVKIYPGTVVKEAIKEKEIVKT